MNQPAEKPALTTFTVVDVLDRILLGMDAHGRGCRCAQCLETIRQARRVRDELLALPAEEQEPAPAAPVH